MVIKNHLSKVGQLFLAMLLSTSVTSCSVEVDNREDKPDVDIANRTILVYMAAANTLTGADNADLREMQTIGRTGTLQGNRLIVYHHNTAGNHILKEVNLKDGNIDTLKIYDNSLSSVSATRMNQVIADTKEFAPAKDYGMVLWSHGNGWLEAVNTPDGRSTDEMPVNPLAFGQDDYTQRGSNLCMNIDVLASTLQNKDFSFFYFDACYMACVEVLYEMRKVGGYVIASTTETIVPGMPYDIGLPYLFAKGKADLNGAIAAIFKYVDTAYGNSENRTGSYAVLNLDKVEQLAVATKEFLKFKPTTPLGFKPQKYMYQTTCYHYDFQDIIENLKIDGDTQTQAEFEACRRNVIDAIGQVVESKYCTPSIWPGTSYQVALEHFCGMSSYYMTSASQASTRGYNKTAWWNDVAKYQFE